MPDLIAIKEKYQAIFETLVDALITIDQSGLIESFNPSAEKMFGYRPEEVLGRNVSMLMEGEHAAQHDGYLHNYQTSGVRKIIGIGREVEARRKDGTLFPIYLAVSEAIVGDKKLFIGVIQDISLRKQQERSLKESEKNLRGAQRLAHLGNWSWDVPSGEITWSEEIYRIFDCRPDAFSPTYKKFLEFVHPDDLERVLASEKAAFERGVSHSIDHRIVLPDGTIRWVHEEAAAQFDQDGRAKSLIGTVQDITDRKNAEAEVIRAKEEAEKANRTKSEFLSRMSHELRTPLNAILGFSQLLEVAENPPLSVDQLSSVAEIIRAGHHLLALINDLLDLSRIESGRLEMNMGPVSTSHSISECISYVEQLAQKRNIKVHVCPVCIDSNVIILADVTRLRQVLINLLNNAVKYNRADGQVFVKCQSADVRRARISVTDTGIGIPADKRDQLFRAFSRLGRDRSEIDGTGIGLIITKNLVEAMNGTIGYESNADGGSTFWIEFPIAENKSSGL